MSASRRWFVAQLFCAGGLALLMASCQREIAPVVSPVRSTAPENFVVYYGKSPQPLSRIDWAIVQDSYRPLSPGKTVYFAYISLGEIDSESTIGKELSAIPGELSRVTLSKNSFWNSRVSDIRKESVRQALLRQVDRDVMAGFGGIFFDTLDSPLEYREQHPGKGKGIRTSIKSFIETVHASYPGIRIVVNRGFEILPLLAPMISGVLYEDFCSRFDEATKAYVLVPERERRSFLEEIGQAKKTNPALVVLALDYEDPSRRTFSQRCGEMARRDGLLHYMSDWTLSAPILPGTPIP